MSALHSIKKNLRPLTPKERAALDRRIVRGEYQSPLSEVHAARDRIEAQRIAPE